MPIPVRASGPPTRLQPGLKWDTATINRPPTTSDSEGNPIGTLTNVGTNVPGFWQYATDTEQLIGAQRGQIVDAVFSCALATNIAIMDQVVVRGHTWEVVTIQDVRTHLRAMLRFMV